MTIFFFSYFIFCSVMNFKQKKEFIARMIENNAVKPCLNQWIKRKYKVTFINTRLNNMKARELYRYLMRMIRLMNELWIRLYAVFSIDLVVSVFPIFRLTMKPLRPPSCCFVLWFICMWIFFFTLSRFQFEKRKRIQS